MNTEKEHNHNNLLVHRYQNGEQKALELLIKRFHPVLLRVIRYHTAQSESFEDIAQDCWYSIIPKLTGLQLKISFDAWALSIARRRSIDWIRKQQRSHIQKDVNISLAELQAGVIDTVEDEDKTQKLQSGIQQLPPTQRIVLNLFYLENLSLQEISEMLSISTGTVKSRLFYARENLKNIITNQMENKYEKGRNR